MTTFRIDTADLQQLTPAELRSKLKAAGLSVTDAPGHRVMVPIDTGLTGHVSVNFERDTKAVVFIQEDAGPLGLKA